MFQVTLFWIVEALPFWRDSREHVWLLVVASNECVFPLGAVFGVPMLVASSEMVPYQLGRFIETRGRLWHVGGRSFLEGALVG